MRRWAVLAAVAALTGCHDFDQGIRDCMSNGICRSNVQQDGGAHFAVALAPTALTLGPGGMAKVSVKLTRPLHNLESLTLSVEAAPGVTSAFESNASSLNETNLALTLPLPFAAGGYAVDVVARKDDGSQAARASLALTVRSPAGTLLVDDDLSANNQGALFAPDSVEDGFFPAALTALGVPFDPTTLRSPWDGGARSPFDVAQVQGYGAIVWYTGSTRGATVNLTAADERLMREWLDLGGKKLLLSSQNFVRDRGTPWDGGSPSTLFTEYLGGRGGTFLLGGPRTLQGVAGQPTSALTLAVGDAGPLPTELGLVNPRPGTQPLFTLTADPDDSGIREVAVATLRTGVGDAGTSTFVYVGFPLVNVADAGAGARQAAFDALRSAAAIP